MKPYEVHQEPTFILADETGKIQLATVTGTLTDAQEKSAALARNRGRPVLLYAFHHVATYLPTVSATSS